MSSRNPERSDLANELAHTDQILGTGAHAEVMAGVLPQFAVKVVLKSNERGLASARREIKILKEISHPFIVTMIKSYETTESLNICLERALGGDMCEILRDLGSLPERVVRVYAAELTSAISYLHDTGYTHRDIKPENILIDQEGHIKLCDFGLCRESFDSFRGMMTLCGTPPYIAPEVYECSAIYGGYGSAVDWWSLGMVIYEALVGQLPWDGQKYHLNYGQYDLYFPKYLSKNATALLKSLLSPNPNRRLGAWNPNEVSSHYFFSGISWADVSQRKVVNSFNPYMSKKAADEFHKQNRSLFLRMCQQFSERKEKRGNNSPMNADYGYGPIGRSDSILSFDG